MSKKIIIGKISTAFGIKGEVKIISYCEQAEQIEKYELFDANDAKISLKISNKNKTILGKTSDGGAVLLAKIDGVNDRNEAEKLRGKEIFVQRSDLPKTKKDEFYLVDLIGLTVLNMKSEKIGKVVNVPNYGAGTIIEIQFTDKKIENSPFKNAIFPEVNLDENFIRLDLPEFVEAK